MALSSGVTQEKAYEQYGLFPLHPRMFWEIALCE
jgi:hypothetical protein